MPTSSPQQIVTLVPSGGTPIRLADAKGRPYPTTGYGSLVFSENPTIRNATLINPSIITPSTTLPLALTEFGAVADGVEYSNGTWNVDSATDNTAAISAWIDACVAQKRPGYAPPGNYLYGQNTAGTTPLMQKAECSGLHIFGNGPDTNFVFVTRTSGQPSKGRQGIILGSGTAGVCWVDPETSPYSFTAEVTTADLVVSVNDTSAFSVGMYLFAADPSQPIPYNANPFNPAVDGSIMYYLSCYVQVKRIISSTSIELVGSTEFNFNAGTKLGYLVAPVTDVIVENMRFSYDLENSPQGGAWSAFNVIGFANVNINNISTYHATSRAFTFRRGINLYIDLMSSVSADPELGSLATIVTMISHGIVRRLSSQGGTHALDFGGGTMTPASHFIVEGIKATDIGGGVVGSHKSAHHLWFSDIDIVGVDIPWGDPNDPEINTSERASAITVRGTDVTVRDANVQRVPIAYRSHKGWRNSWIDCTHNECGVGLYIDDCNDVAVRNLTGRNTLYWNVDLKVNIGPNQNLPLIQNIKLDNIQSLETLPALGDLQFYIGGQYSVDKCFRTLGWSLSNMQRNGAVALIVGTGAAVSQFPTYSPSPLTEFASQLISPAYVAAPSTGAVSAVVASTAGVTSGYVDGEILPVPGGTFPSGQGGPAELRVETLQIQTLEIDDPGFEQAAGDVLTLDGGSPITRATVEVDTVDGDGRILTFHIVNPGNYLSAPTSFGQFSTTGTANSIFITSTEVINGGSGARVGDIITAAGGTPVRIDGVAQWPLLEVISVIGNGNITATTVVDGGAFVALSPALYLDQRETTGQGTRSSYTITGFVSKKASFKNALIVPKTVSIAQAGSKYLVTPTNPVTPVSTNGTGAGATFDVTYGIVADVGLSPKMQSSVTGSASSIVNLGPRRGVYRGITFTGAQTLVHSATLKLPNGGGNIVTAVGDTLVAWSDFSNPVVWTVEQYTRASGVALRQAIADAPASASATGVAGEVRYASGFLYVCVATNTWQRVAIATF